MFSKLKIPELINTLMEEKTIPVTWSPGQHSYTAIIPKEQLKGFGFDELKDAIVVVGTSELLIKKNEKKKRSV